MGAPNFLDQNYSCLINSEILATFVLGFVYTSLIKSKKDTEDFYGMCVGGASMFLVIAFGPGNGGCFNPARLVGTMILSKIETSQIFMLFCPFVGCLFGALFHEKCFGVEDVAVLFEDDES